MSFFTALHLTGMEAGLNEHNAIYFAGHERTFISLEENPEM